MEGNLVELPDLGLIEAIEATYALTVYQATRLAVRQLRGLEAAPVPPRPAALQLLRRLRDRADAPHP